MLEVLVLTLKRQLWCANTDHFFKDHTLDVLGHYSYTAHGEAESHLYADVKQKPLRSTCPSQDLARPRKIQPSSHCCSFTHTPSPFELAKLHHEHKHHQGNHKPHHG